jgi:hypothetical protein
MMENDKHDCWSGSNVRRETSKTSVDVPVLKRDLNESDETSSTCWSEDNNNTRSCASFCSGDNTNNNTSNYSSLGETSFNKFNKSLAVKNMGSDDHLEGRINRSTINTLSNLPTNNQLKLDTSHPTKARDVGILMMNTTNEEEAHPPPAAAMNVQNMLVIQSNNKVMH